VGRGGVRLKREGERETENLDTHTPLFIFGFPEMDLERRECVSEELIEEKIFDIF